MFWSSLLSKSFSKNKIPKVLLGFFHHHKAYVTTVKQKNS